MFSLIITIVSIALVVALVAATMYHGGDTLTQGRVTAKAAEYVAGAQQIAGAFTMHQALNGKNALTATELASAGILKSVPGLFDDAAGGTSSIILRDERPAGLGEGNTFSFVRSPQETLTLEECQALDKMAGRAPTPAGSFPFATVNLTPGFDAWHAYGCYQGEGYGFYFKI